MQIWQRFPERFPAFMPTSAQRNFIVNMTKKTIKCYHNEKYLQKIISDLEQIKNYTLKIKIHILSLKPQLILTNYEIILKNERIYFLSYFQVCSSNKYRK